MSGHCHRLATEPTVGRSPGKWTQVVVNQAILVSPCQGAVHNGSRRFQYDVRRVEWVTVRGSEWSNLLSAQTVPFAPWGF